MNTLPPVARTNTILYCEKWVETVDFYAEQLGLPVSYRSSWFVEFALSETTRVSIADASRTTVESAAGKGITLSLKMKDIESVWRFLRDAGVTPTPIKDHPMEARVFYFFDPEGHRIEIWSPSSAGLSGNSLSLAT
jgi:predicted enzyme related to lactoylglutathione lyase